MSQRSSQLAEIQSVNDGLADVNGTSIQIFLSFAQQLKIALFGQGAVGPEAEETGGARILSLFSHSFASSLQALDARECVSVRAIRTAVVNNRGMHGGLFVSEKALEQLILQCLARFEAPCFLCAEQVKTEFQNLISTIRLREFTYFPQLREAVLRETLALLEEKAGIAKEMLRILLAMERAYINTAQPALSAASLKQLQGRAIASARAVGLLRGGSVAPPAADAPERPAGVPGAGDAGLAAAARRARAVGARVRRGEAARAAVRGDGDGGAERAGRGGGAAGGRASRGGEE